VLDDATGIAEAVRDGRTTVRAAVMQALDRITAHDGPLNAFTVTLQDRALAQADAADERIRRDVADLPPLFGVPVSVKDHIWLAGAPATNGSRALADFVPAEDCVCVARLEAAGAIVVGKTNNPEFCYRGYTDNQIYGLTRNPWNLDRTPGGSSGGAAVSVAAGMVPLALGTDGGGSIRIPSAFCGVVGHKPTFGLVPKEPGFKGWKSLSVDGPMARSVRDVALCLQAMAGSSTADDMTWPVPVADYTAAVLPHDLTGLRIAYSADFGGYDVARDVRAAFERAVRTVAAATGATVIPDHPHAADPAPLWNSIALVEGYASEGPLLAEWADQMSPGIADIVAAGRDITGWRYVDALHERAAFTRAWADFFSRHDVLLAPAMPITAFSVDEQGPASIDGHPVDPFFDDWCTLALPANLTGQPATTVPMGPGDDGMPTGMQILCRRFDDATALAVAAAYERAVPDTVGAHAALRASPE
jgi:Asp-tRNA(Asn)/Glu-tRNA(Gln) amidotransferase A subunit family amidase